MFRLYLDSIAKLSCPVLVSKYIPAVIQKLAPKGKNQNSWLAGRVLLSNIAGIENLVNVQYGPQGKPRFPDEMRLYFNISHSVDTVALFVSDECEVGCDIELIRPRRNWPQIAETCFSFCDLTNLYSLPDDQQLTEFWRLWTRYEAKIKLFGLSVLQQRQQTSGAVSRNIYHHDVRIGDISISLCAENEISSDIVNSHTI
jgi:4'-phosphopantetheinyl transferase